MQHEPQQPVGRRPDRSWIGFQPLRGRYDEDWAGLTVTALHLAQPTAEPLIKEAPDR